MNEDLRNQINDIIEGEIQLGINDYLESKQKKEKSNISQVKKLGLVDKHGRPL